jgi:ribosomal protein S18 acetylase RimI-like enzyme
MNVHTDITGLIEDHFVRSWALVGAAAGGALVERDEFQLTLSALDHVPYNHIQRCTAIREPEAVIDTVLELLGEHEAIWSVVPSSSPADLAVRLSARGCSLYSLLTGMALDLVKAIPEEELSSELRIEEVGPHLLDAYVELVLSQWHLSEEDRATLVAMNQDVGFEQMRRWLCYVNGVPMAKAVAVMLEPTCAGVYGVGTTSEARGRGLASVLMREILRALQQAGMRTVVLHSTPMAVNLYRRLGFVEHCQIPVYAVPRSQPPAERMARI